MDSLVCELLYEPFDPDAEMRIALRQSARVAAQRLAQSNKDGPARIGYRLWLIENLEACKAVGEHFWRNVVIDVRDIINRESES